MISSQLQANEFNPYYKHYIDLAHSSNVIDALQQSKEDTISFYKSLPANKVSFKYAPEKWTPKQILLHIIDTERVFAYRALFFSRAKNTSLVGFDQDEFINNAVKDVSLEKLLKEYEQVREASISLFERFSNEDLLKIGVASNSEMSVRAIGYVICGHEAHHIAVIKERYL